MNSPIQIISGFSVGSLPLGLPLTAYERLLGPAEDRFKRTPECLGFDVQYKSQHVNLTVDATGNVAVITVFRPLTAELENVQLLDRQLTSVGRDLAKTNWRFVREQAGLWCEEARVLLIEVDGIIDGVEVASPRLKIV